jgi:hypothetical protein
MRSKVLVKGDAMGGTRVGKYILNFCRINLHERKTFEEIVIDGKIKFTWILKKYDTRMWTRVKLRT